MTRIPLVLVGLNFGRWILKELHESPASEFIEVKGVCDLDADKARQYGEQYGVPWTSSLDAVLSDDAITAVGLFTGPIGRAGLVQRIVEAGKHVMTTKPFELDPQAALKVLRLARQKHRVVHLNSPSPIFSPDLACIQEWIQRHQLGRPVAARTDVWVSYREQANGSWYDDPALCPAAPVFRLGIYLINDLVRLLGPASEVVVLQSRLFTGRPTADNAQLGIRFADGALANVFGSFCVDDGDKYRNALTLNFERGTIYRNVGPHQAPGVPAQMALVQNRNEVRVLVEERNTVSGSGTYMWDVFARAVRGEVLPDEVTPEQIAAGVAVVAAMRDAAASGNCTAVAVCQ